MQYLGNITVNALSFFFFVFAITVLGYLLGVVDVKGISLGTAGVLVVALAFGIFTSFVPSFVIGGTEVVLFDESVKAKYSLISSLGTVMFVTSVGLIAGPKFFRSFNRTFLSYITIGAITIASGVLVTIVCILLDGSLNASMAVGLMTGALTSTPGLSAAKEISSEPDFATAGYGIAYLFGVLGVVFFVQIVPKILHTDIEAERKRFIAADNVKIDALSDSLKQMEPLSFFPFALTASLGCILGAIKIPGINFSLGNSGGCLLAGLIVGHFGHLGKIDLRIQKSTLNFFRELGLVLFLIGAGVPGGINFTNSIRISYFFYGVLMTLVPMCISYLVAAKIFKLDVLNSLGSITGGMTSTPALGALIRTAGTDEVAASYAATYPIALVFVVIASKILILVF